MANKPYSFPNSTPMDHLLMQSLMSRLQIGSPASNDSPSSLFRDLFPQLAGDGSSHSDDDRSDPEPDFVDLPEGRQRRRTVAREETKLEREIIRMIRSGNAAETLKANSGQSVAIGEHNICVGFHEETAGNYRIWEWHGHIMMFDDDEGFTAEYVYGNHFERLPDKKVVKEEKEEEEEEDQMYGCSGLKDLIGDLNNSSVSSKGRVLHRNSLSAASCSKYI